MWMLFLWFFSLPKLIKSSCQSETVQRPLPEDEAAKILELPKTGQLLLVDSTYIFPLFFPLSPLEISFPISFLTIVLSREDRVTALFSTHRISWLLGDWEISNPLASEHNKHSAVYFWEETTSSLGHRKENMWEYKTRVSLGCEACVCTPQIQKD